jgi:hypothetical protein
MAIKHDYETGEDVYVEDDEISSTSPLFGEGLSPLFGTETSDLAPVLTPQPLGFDNDTRKEVNRTGGGRADLITGELKGDKKKKPQSKFEASLGPLSAGMEAGLKPQTPTTDLAEAGAEIGTSVLSGAVGGALSGSAIGAAGGPIGALSGAAIGAVSALVISGTKAWFNVRSSRRKAREMRELQRKLEKQRQEDIARNEKWARLNHFRSLQDAEATRAGQLLLNKWSGYQNVASQMIGLVNSDANLNQLITNQMKGA